MQRKHLIPLVGILIVAFGSLIATLAAGSSPTLGLDLQGGASVVLQPKEDIASTDVLDTSIEIIRNRVDALGVAEPEISRQGDAILIELPGVKDQDRALELVGQTAELRFRPVLQVGTSSPDDGTTDTTVPGTASTTVAPASSTAATSTATSTGSTVVGGPGGAVGLPRQATTTVAPSATTAPATTVATTDTTAGATTTTGDATATTVPTVTTVPSVTTVPPIDPSQVEILPGTDGVTQYIVGPPGATGAIVQDAQARFDPTGQWTVQLEFTSDGIDLFNALAAQCYNAANPALCPSGALAIELDGVVQSAPQVNAPSFSRDDVQISGNFTEGEAKDLALVLRYGALPVELEPQAVQTVSATLGKDSLRAGIIAGLVGVALVLAFMLAYYRALGLVVLLGITVSGCLLYSFVSLLSETRGLALTLSGCAGIIVSIGVTVDSYVVYFERLKDEVRSGKTLRSSAERGFSQAYRTILAADGASLIGALLLYWLTVGAVRGFAFYLALSTLLDMVIAYFFTRPLVIILARKLKGTKILGVSMGEALTPAESGVTA